MDPLIRIKFDDALISLAQLESIRAELEKGDINDRNELIKKANDLTNKINSNIPKFSLLGNFISNSGFNYCSLSIKAYLISKSFVQIEAKYLKQINQRFKKFSKWFKDYQKSKNSLTSSQKIKSRSKSAPLNTLTLPIKTVEPDYSQIESIECSLTEDQSKISNISSSKSIIKKTSINSTLTKPNKNPVVFVSEPTRKKYIPKGRSQKKEKFGILSTEDVFDSNTKNNTEIVDNCENKGLRIKLIQNNELLPLNLAKVTIEDFKFN